MKTYSVEECGKLISTTFRKDYVYRNLTVRGTVYGLHTHFSGITFFTLMEGTSRLSCFIGRARNTFLTRNLESGLTVSVEGDLRYNEVRGCPVLYVSRVLKAVESAEKKAHAALVEKLAALGYFDPARKKRLPRFPFLIGVVTSGSGAVIHDILKTGTLRNPAVGYRLYNASVQGEGAVAAMVSKIREANEGENPPDVLILARGGGAEEDLTPFNEEILLTAIFQSHIPVVSAVGHETDVTLADQVADARASTPTQAAELAVPLAADVREAVLAPLHFLSSACRDAVSDERAMVRSTLSAMASATALWRLDRDRQVVYLTYNGLKDNMHAALLAAYRRTGDTLVTLMEGVSYGPEGKDL